MKLLSGSRESSPSVRKEYIDDWFKLATLGELTDGGRQGTNQRAGASTPTGAQE